MMINSRCHNSLISLQMNNTIVSIHSDDVRHLQRHTDDGQSQTHHIIKIKLIYTC